MRENSKISSHKFGEVMNKVYLLWMWLSEFLGIINTWIILTFLYFFIITPLGFLMKIFGKDPLKLKVQKSAVTFWEDGENVEGSSIKRQF